MLLVKKINKKYSSCIEYRYKSIVYNWYKFHRESDARITINYTIYEYIETYGNITPYKEKTEEKSFTFDSVDNLFIFIKRELKGVKIIDEK